MGTSRDCGGYHGDECCCICCSCSCEELFGCESCACESRCWCWWWLLGFFVVVLLIILIVYLVLLPTKPVFVLNNIRVLRLNVTGPGTLTSSLQVTLESRNPNNRISIYYDSLYVYAVFMNQQIMPGSALQPAYQGENDIRDWSQQISGTDVPVAPYVVESLHHGLPSYGTFSVQMDGRVRWKVGTWTSGNYGIHVQCDAYIPCNGDRVVSTSGSYMVYPCHTDVWSQP